MDSIPTMPTKQHTSAKKRTSRHKPAPDGDDSDGGGESSCNLNDVRFRHASLVRLCVRAGWCVRYFVFVVDVWSRDATRLFES